MFKVDKITSGICLKSQILALGTDTRQRISWSKSGKIYSLSPAKEYEDLKEFYFKASGFIKKRFNLMPEAITFDPHPYFVVSEEAAVIRDRYFPRAKLLKVFHHEAHLASFVLEAGLKDDFLGLAFDGTGYGRDGRIWGSEFFIYRNRRFKRVAHFDYLALLGSDAAIRQPWRVAFGVLYKIYGPELFGMGFDFLKGIKKSELKLLASMLEKNFNIAYATSCGRLFDAASSILNIKTKAVKEAEAAVALEVRAAHFTGEVLPYSFDIFEKGEEFVVDFTEMFKEMASDSFDKERIALAARRFHATIALAVGRVCRKLKDTYSIKKVYASGGVFMNNILTEDVGRILKEDGFSVTMAGRPETTDYGISLGQIAAAEIEMMK